MEFEEMQAIWNEQNSVPAYKIDENELHRRIQARKNKAVCITRISELMVIGVYTCAGIIVLAANVTSRKQNIFLYCMAAWMLMVALLSVIARARRLIAARRFDRSVRGELQYAQATAKYQVRLSRLMRWNILPIGVFALLGIWEGGKPAWVLVLVLLFFVAAFYASGFEHRLYTRQRDSLDEMQRSLNE